jgi:hypothetical protein
VLYNLLLVDAVPTKTLISDKQISGDSSHFDDGNTPSYLEPEDYVDVQNALEESKDNNQEEIFLGYMDDSSQLYTRFGNTEGKGQDRPNLSKSNTRCDFFYRKIGDYTRREEDSDAGSQT